MPDAETAGGAEGADRATGAAQSSFGAARPAIDIAAMLRSLDNDMPLAQTLAQLFLDSSPLLLARMRLALAGGDAGELGRAAHEMRGAIGNFRAAAGVAAAAGVEGAAQRGDMARAARNFAALEAEIDRLFPVLEKLKDAGGAGASA